MKLKHMDMPWSVECEYNEFSIYAHCKKESWWICGVREFLPNDISGKKTAQRICDEHNAALSARLVKGSL